MPPPRHQTDDHAGSRKENRQHMHACMHAYDPPLG
jgi:hypothetical protein